MYQMKKLFTVCTEEGIEELNEMREYYKIFGDNLPGELVDELNSQEARFKS